MTHQRVDKHIFNPDIMLAWHPSRMRALGLFCNDGSMSPWCHPREQLGSHPDSEVFYFGY